jgi:hypothetical protein
MPERFADESSYPFLHWFLLQHNSLVFNAQAKSAEAGNQLPPHIGGA